MPVKGPSPYHLIKGERENKCFYETMAEVEEVEENYYDASCYFLKAAKEAKTETEAKRLNESSQRCLRLHYLEENNYENF